MELGVFEVIPVAVKRCVVKLDDKKAAAKVNRWQGIAEAAAKQCRRGIIPMVKEPMSMKAAVAYAHHLDVKLIPYELADDMGLGKTLQAIAFLLSEFLEAKAEDNRRCLIVAPASLVFNWNSVLRFLSARRAGLRRTRWRRLSRQGSSRLHWEKGSCAPRRRALRYCPG